MVIWFFLFHHIKLTQTLTGGDLPHGNNIHIITSSFCPHCKSTIFAVMLYIELNYRAFVLTWFWGFKSELKSNSAIQFHYTKSIDYKILTADKPGRMNTNFTLHHRLFIRSFAHDVQRLTNDEESFWSSSAAWTQGTEHSIQAGSEQPLQMFKFSTRFLVRV